MKPSSSPVSVRRRREPDTSNRRRDELTRFVQRQKRQRDWINFAEIADWCGREDGQLEPNEKKRALAFAWLAADTISGEFDEGGRPKVLFKHPEVRTRVTHAWMRQVTENNLDSEQGRSGYLPYCWIPRAMFERWLAKYRLPASSYFSPSQGAGSNTRSSPVDPETLRKSPLGRPPEYNWPGVEAKLADWIAQHGPIASQAELLQKAGDFAQDLHPDGRRPDDSTIRSTHKKYSLL